MPTDQRLIEDYIPIEAISAEARREKSVRKGHISMLQLRWARRRARPSTSVRRRSWVIRRGWAYAGDQQRSRVTMNELQHRLYAKTAQGTTLWYNTKQTL